MSLRGAAPVALAAAAALALSGCVAAAVPAVAGAGIFKARQDRQKRGARAEAEKPAVLDSAQTAQGTWRRVDATALPAPDAPSTPVTAPAASARATGAAPPEMQYLYGSGEAAALSLQAYQAMWNYLNGDIRYRRDKSQIRSVVLAPGSTIDNPKFDTCGKRPLAAVFDVDETVLLNLGFEADAAARGGAYDAARWSRWEASGADKVAAVPGAAETLAAARREGIAIVFNSNRSVATAAQTIAALENAGLGPAVLGETLFLRGEGEPSGKDARRAKIAERWCVVAMAGDQLGDFSDLFNVPGVNVLGRRNRASETLLAPLWGAGWFMLPNPVYGTGLHGTVDEIFPPDKRWADPQEKK